MIQDPLLKNTQSRERDLRLLRERIVGFAASRIGREAAEDAAQEVLLLLHKKYGHLESLDDLLPLSFRIVRFQMMAMRRKLLRRGEMNAAAADELPLADTRADPEMEAERHELRDRLIRAISELGERCRRIFALKIAGRSFAEIQKALGAASINTVYTWDFRCRNDLKARMGGAWETRP